MKKIQYLLVLALVGLFAASCSEGYLTQKPGGSTITKEQYLRMDNIVEGTVKGMYTMLYPYGGEHDVFGQRSIDMYGDLLCGDMALKTRNYGWFSTDELMETYGRRGYYWAYYYDFIRSANIGILSLSKTKLPTLTFDEAKATDEELLRGNYYAQLLTMRGWAYAGLSRTFMEVGAVGSELAVPIYTEEDAAIDTLLGRPRATSADVYLRIEEDLQTAIQFFDAYKKVPRASKIEANIDMARIILAYSYLNKGEYANAFKYATQAIDSGKPHLLPKAEVLTTGFNNVENQNWIWGQDVTVETTTALASFFGQCDIYSYSYASAGDVKAIDENLYNEIKDWDIRKNWWNNYGSSSKKNASNYEYAPDGKFYSAKSKTLQGDRDWLSDNIFMRWELAYLIAAEAAARDNNLTDAVKYLTEITKLRVLDGKDAEYTAWESTLTDLTTVLAAIKHNWRVEMWGEGYGLQTFRRYGESVKLGNNHLRSEKNITPTTIRIFTFELPTSELEYNPYIREAATGETQIMRQQ